MMCVEEPRNAPEETVPADRVTVLVAEDQMAAHMAVAPSTEGDASLSVEAVMARLQEAGVTHGIDHEAVLRIVEEAGRRPAVAEPSTPVLVARGQDPVPGEDARIDYHPVLASTGGRPRVLPDGSVDLFDLDLVRNVSKGTVLAVRTPPTRGEAGVTVLGTVIPPTRGRDLRLGTGRGAALSEDRLSVTAQVDGHATRVGERILVTNLYEVDSDVGTGTGNIHFVGGVVIKGFVRAGFLVKAEGDVDVHGGIEGGAVEAGGNVSVRYGIRGGRVVAGGTVRARFMERAQVQAGGSVWAADGILNSRVDSGGSVEVLGVRGAIIGGRTTAKNNVSARYLGSEIQGATEIAAGVLPALREEMLESRRKQTGLEDQIRRTDVMVLCLAEQYRHVPFPRDKREAMFRLVESRDSLRQDLEAARARYAELEQVAREARACWIQATGICYPGVSLFVSHLHHVVTEPMARSRFRLDDNKGLGIASL